MGEEDIAEVAALLRAVEATDHHAALGEHQWLDLVQGGRVGSAGFVARSSHRSRLLGYAQLSRGTDSWAVEVAVHPSHRHDGLAGDLLAAALAEVAAQGGGHVHFWKAHPGPEDDAMAAAVGMARGRELFQMRRSLPLEPELASLADAVTVRPFRVGVDEAAWLELNNRAFGGHPEQGSWDLATIEARESQPWFDPEGFLLHEDESRLTGFCWTKIADDDEDGPGEIYVIGVDPTVQHHGLGKGLLAAGCNFLAARSRPSVQLYVDAASEAAVALYRAFGFEVNHHDRAYVADVAAAT